MVKNNAEGPRFGRSPSRFCEPGGIAVDGVPQAAREDDGIAVDGEDEGREAVAAGGVLAERHGERHGRERLGRVEFSGDDFFADGGPTDLGGEADIDAAGCEEAEVPRDQQGGGVQERDVAQAQSGRGAAACGGGCWNGSVHGQSRDVTGRDLARYVPEPTLWRDECYSSFGDE